MDADSVSVLATISTHLNKMRTFDRLGGSDSFFGFMYVFEELMREEHGKDGLTSGMYSFKGMGQYGNIVSHPPFLRACAKFVEMGYDRSHFERLRDWWTGANRGPDEACLGVMLKYYIQNNKLPEHPVPEPEPEKPKRENVDPMTVLKHK